MPRKNIQGETQKKSPQARETSTYLPNIFSGFSSKHPEIISALESLAEICQKSGPLDKKTAELVKLGVSVGINSEGSVRSHTRRALDAGNSSAEIRHAILLSLTTAGYPHAMAAYKWVEEVLEKQG